MSITFVFQNNDNRTIIDEIWSALETWKLDCSCSHDALVPLATVSQKLVKTGLVLEESMENIDQSKLLITENSQDGKISMTLVDPCSQSILNVEDKNQTSHDYCDREYTVSTSKGKVSFC